MAWGGWGQVQNQFRFEQGKPEAVLKWNLTELGEGLKVDCLSPEAQDLWSRLAFEKPSTPRDIYSALDAIEELNPFRRFSQDEGQINFSVEQLRYIAYTMVALDVAHRVYLARFITGLSPRRATRFINYQGDICPRYWNESGYNYTKNWLMNRVSRDPEATSREVLSRFLEIDSMSIGSIQGFGEIF